jgi:hypothetical protein
MFEVLKIEKDYEGAFFITVDGQEAWELSGELIKQLLKEIRNHLNGEFGPIASLLLKRFLLDESNAILPDGAGRD